MPPHGPDTSENLPDQATASLSVNPYTTLCATATAVYPVILKVKYPTLIMHVYVC